MNPCRIYISFFCRFSKVMCLLLVITTFYSTFASLSLMQSLNRIQSISFLFFFSYLFRLLFVFSFTARAVVDFFCVMCDIQMKFSIKNATLKTVLNNTTSSKYYEGKIYPHTHTPKHITEHTAFCNNKIKYNVEKNKFPFILKSLRLQRYIRCVIYTTFLLTTNISQSIRIVWMCMRVCVCRFFFFCAAHCLSLRYYFFDLICSFVFYFILYISFVVYCLFSAFNVFDKILSFTCRCSLSHYCVTEDEHRQYTFLGYIKFSLK